MKDYTAEVIKNEEIAPGGYMLELSLKNLESVKAGQFAMLEVPKADCILRRPLGICMADKDYAAFIYQVKGSGTEALTELTEGDSIKVTMPLGNGFPTENQYSKVAVVGGGFGIIPLYLTAAAYGNSVLRIYNGFASKKNIMLKKQFEALGKLTVCTDDGSVGYHGYPVSALEKDIEDGFLPDAIFCCGPDPLMRAVKALGERKGIETYLSLETHMGCGIGACLTCTCKVAGHNKRVCKDGPVFPSKEVFE